MSDSVTYSRIDPATLIGWGRVRAAAAGGDAVRAMAPSALPYLNPTDRSAANQARNAAYSQRAVWLGATGGTLEGLLGMAFRVDPRSDMPDSLRRLLVNTDGAGVSLYQQSQQTLSNVLQVGRHGLLADLDGAGESVIKVYAAENIINWRYAMVGNEQVLSLLVLREVFMRQSPTDEFGQEQITQYLVFRCDPETRVVTSQLYSPDVANGALVARKVRPVRAAGGLTLREIPFVPVGSKTNDFGAQIAPLGAIAEVNLAHYRNSADYEDMLWNLGQAQPWITGLDPQDRNFLMAPYTEDENGVRTPYPEMYWGSRMPLLLGAGAQVGYAQLSPNDAQRQAMQDKEAQMRALGARLIEASGGPKTATGEDNDREASTSVLSMCVSNVNEAYQRAIGWCALLRGVRMSVDEAQGTYKISQDFTRIAADPALLAQLMAMWQSGALPRQDLWAWTRRVGLVATERTDEALAADIEAEGPPVPDPEPVVVVPPVEVQE